MIGTTRETVNRTLNRFWNDRLSTCARPTSSSPNPTNCAPWWGEGQDLGTRRTGLQSSERL